MTRERFDPLAREKLHETHAGFFRAEWERTNNHRRNPPFLRRLWAWAQDERKPVLVIQAIEQALASYAVQDAG